jgi:hypothetical protein
LARSLGEGPSRRAELSRKFDHLSDPHFRYGAEDSGIRVSSYEFRVSGSFRVSDFGFRVQSLRCWGWNSQAASYAVKGTWHIQDSQGQIPALTFI